MKQLSRETEAHKTHHLKIYPEHFSAVLTGVKRAELRKNDRDYKVGDTLHLMETPKGSCSPTGEFVNAVVTHIADVSDWLPGYVLLSIERELGCAAPPAPVSQPVQVPECFVRFHQVIKDRHHGRMPEEVQNAFDECAAMLKGAGVTEKCRSSKKVQEQQPTLQPSSGALQLPDWKDEQCLEFLSIAFRHAEIKGDLELDDIRLGVKMVNASAAAPQEPTK